MKLKLISAIIVAAFLASIAVWQLYPRRGLIGGEAVNFFESYGNWETLCDQLPNDPNSARCYLRLVDVYSPRPDFGAYVGFITMDEKGNQSFELSLEPGAQLLENGFKLLDNENETWMLDQKVCSENRCKITGIELERMVNAARNAQQFEINFVDKAGKTWQRNLSSGDFTKAHQAFLKASDNRQ